MSHAAKIAKTAKPVSYDLKKHTKLNYEVSQLQESFHSHCRRMASNIDMQFYADVWKSIDADGKHPYIVGDANAGAVRFKYLEQAGEGKKSAFLKELTRQRLDHYPVEGILDCLSVKVENAAQLEKLNTAAIAVFSKAKIRQK